ncbi:hypothetical protein LWI28_014902 [Acer negundo]|uniref:Uncharacterized protein n=1 Tax=Acer negundo TaxID=4023 RepID=A0AAD5IN21_ACENE|nr:hypothetical protein LWI28_014902 [Acer negundo]
MGFWRRADNRHLENPMVDMDPDTGPPPPLDSSILFQYSLSRSLSQHHILFFSFSFWSLSSHQAQLTAFPDRRKPKHKREDINRHN